MTDNAAAGERFLATSGDAMKMVEVAELLRLRLGKAADKVSTQVMPDEQVRLMSETNPQLKMVATLLGYDMSATGRKAKCRLGWAPRSREDSIIASAESLIRLRLIRAF